MSLVISGLSHRTSDVAFRDRVAISQESLPRALEALRERLDDMSALTRLVSFAEVTWMSFFPHNTIGPRRESFQADWSS